MHGYRSLRLLLFFVVWSLCTDAFLEAAGVREPQAITSPVVLEYWTALNPLASRSVSNLGETLMYRELEKRSGLHIRFIHPPQGQAEEELTLMIASREFPDIIESNWTTYDGGPQKAVGDGVIIRLNRYIDEYAPNYRNLLDKYPHIKKMVLTDMGTFYAFPCIGLTTQVFRGLWIRRDWLERLELEPPRTIDEWDTVLRVMRERFDLEAPLTFDGPGDMNHPHFQGAFGVSSGFFRRVGVVHYGPIEDGYREYLELFRKWYADGLLDRDFANNDPKAKDYNILNDKSCAFYGYTGSDAGMYLSAKARDSSFDLVPVQYPVLEEGMEPEFLSLAWNYRGYGAAAITTTNEHPAETASWLDYLYTEEGKILRNFGVEGVTFEMVNGYPTYTDLITANPDGLSLGEALAKYCQANYQAPGIIDERYREQYYLHPAQKESFRVFTAFMRNALQVTLPPITPLSDEAIRLAAIMSEIRPYKDEYFLRFVMGQEPPDEFDRYVQQILKMGIGTAIEIQQAALNRYMSR